MLNFLPLSDEDLNDLVPEGEYDFLVKASENYRNQTNGNQSIKLTVGIYDKNGRERTIFCYLSPNYMILLKHFCDATGLESAYQAGNLSAEMCLNQSGKCKIVTEQPKEGSNYPAKNVIKGFIKRDKIAPIAAPRESDFVDSDIPF